MKKIQINKEMTEYINDCCIIKEKAEQFGYEITIEQAYLLWSSYSGSRCAGWLGLPRFDTTQEYKEFCESKGYFFSEYDGTWENIFTDNLIESLGFDIIDQIEGEQ